MRALEQFKVAREHGTERAFSGVYADHHAKGTYPCVCCLFVGCQV